MSIKLIRKNYFEIIPIATFFLFLFYLFLYFIFCFFPFFKKSLDQMAGDTRLVPRSLPSKNRRHSQEGFFNPWKDACIVWNPNFWYGQHEQHLFGTADVVLSVIPFTFLVPRLSSCYIKIIFARVRKHIMLSTNGK